MRRVALFLIAVVAVSAQSVQYDESRKVWLLSTRVSSYAMGVSPDGQLQHLYWGGPLWRIADVPTASTKEDISSFDPHEMLENEEYAGLGRETVLRDGAEDSRGRMAIATLCCITSPQNRWGQAFDHAERHQGRY